MRLAARLLPAALASALALGACKSEKPQQQQAPGTQGGPTIQRPTPVTEYGGIGASLGYEGKQMVFNQVREGTPAERAGLKVGDPLLKIDGVDTSKLSMEEAVKAIRGVVGTQVVLTIGGGDAGAPRDVSLTREVQQRRGVAQPPPGAQPPANQPVQQPAPAPGQPPAAPQQPVPQVPPPAPTQPAPTQHK